MYTPPFTISAEAINKIAEISGQIERYAIRLEQKDALHLRKANRIRTIHSSLAIEGNKLTEDEVRDIINGKNIVAPIREIQEVKNAIKTYEMYPHLDAFKEEDLNTVHYKVHDKYPNITDSAWNVLDYLGATTTHQRKSAPRSCQCQLSGCAQTNLSYEELLYRC